MNRFESPAFAKLCERLYGKNLLQMSMCTMDEIRLLIEHMEFDPGNKVLDLGVCFGRITEYLCDETGADFTGIDITSEDIATTKSIERDNLHFMVADMTALPFENNSFDKIISIDSLYFVANLEKTLDDIIKVLKPDGRLGILWSQPPRIKMEATLPEYTEIGRWAITRQLPYMAIDRSKEHKEHWQKAFQLFEEMQSEFEVEGTYEAWKEHMDENREVLPVVAADRFPRWLFIIENKK